MSIIITADLHLTDNPRDNYRWGLFPWLAKQIEKYQVSEVGILGDITDAKDRHPGTLANKMVEGFLQITKADAQVYFNPGNHDGVDENNIYFAFLKNIKGIKFIDAPYLTNLTIGDCLFLPQTRDYKTAWEGLDFSKPEWIFTHQTYDGCLTENGTRLEGIPPSIFAKTKAKVISGDIHVPQRVSKNVEYVGAPYRIRFGDNFKPRVLLIQDDGKQKDLHFSTINKHLIEIRSAHELFKAFDDADVREGDQVKVRVAMPRKAYPDWPAMRAKIVEDCQAAGVALTGPELLALPERQKPRAEAQASALSAFAPDEAIGAYAESAGVSGPLLKAGRVWLKEAIGGK